MEKTHRYNSQLQWTGNKGEGTKSYTAYDRSYMINIEGKTPLHGSSDPVFRGDAAKYNPEELLLMALTSCHLLWFLHLCADEGINVIEYADNAEAILQLNIDGSGQFKEVILHPEVTVINDVTEEQLRQLHDRAHSLCFIARSCNFPVRHEPSLITN